MFLVITVINSVLEVSCRLYSAPFCRVYEQWNFR